MGLVVLVGLCIALYAIFCIAFMCIAVFFPDGSIMRRLVPIICGFWLLEDHHQNH